MSEKKIVFFDIDGTLADESTCEIPESTIEAMKLARERGHIMIVNTGRAYCAVADAIKALPLDGFICSCGIDIWYHGKEIFHDPLPESLCKKLITESFAGGWELVLENRDKLYFPRGASYPPTHTFRAVFARQDIPLTEYGPEDDYLTFDKMVLWYEPERNVEKFMDLFRPDLGYIRRAANFLEILPDRHSKATGIDRLLGHLGMSIEDTLSIGDSTNDLPMLKHTKESVAMGNSHPDVFQYVTYTTTDIHDNGIYNALKHFELI